MLENVQMKNVDTDMIKTTGGDYTFIIRETVPTTGETGFASDCICIHTDATNGSAFLVNDGDATGGTFVIREA